MKFSLIEILLTIVFPLPIAAYFIYKVRKTKGCLYGKTPAQKDDFFRSLFSFRTKDPEFLKEQFKDLKPHEQKEFLDWIDQQNECLRQIQSMIPVLEKLLKDKSNAN